jgi:hypothetical protein
MKKLLAVAAVVLGTAALVAPVLAQAPPEVPFPAPKSAIFLAADTVTASGNALGADVRTNRFSRGASVVFRAFAGDTKTGRVLTDKDVRYFYLTIPGQPNLKLAFSKQGTAASAAWLWTATWTVPADYPLGLVPFRLLIQTKAKQRGIFQQVPVATAQLTVTAA